MESAEAVNKMTEAIVGMSENFVKVFSELALILS
jgi:hypothetical protein